jgi:hypothetical protein
MTLRYYLGDLQEILDPLNECGWGPEKRKMQRKQFNRLRRQTFKREEIVCTDCDDAPCELWGELPDTRTRILPGMEEETFRVLTAFCTTCADSGGDPFPEDTRFEEVVE